jgi:hypothetical protein
MADVAPIDAGRVRPVAIVADLGLAGGTLPRHADTVLVTDIKNQDRTPCNTERRPPAAIVVMLACWRRARRMLRGDVSRCWEATPR